MFKKILRIVAAIVIANAICQAQQEAARAPHIGAGIKLSLLGIGGEAAIPITNKMDIRGGLNALSYSRNFDKDGVAYAGKLSFRTIEAHYDWFPFTVSFHISPGALVYNGNKVTANASVAGGQIFDLNDTTYFSDPANPITGKGKIDFKKVAPTFTIGWGTLVPHNGHHWSIPFEIGAAYQNAPRATLSLPGGACDSG
ncbi:MAG TPA: hypothetical protein VFQ43_07980, partial [Nitrososphaera sp.]|nr:hypothetical protein [Nitrososphaera sp.]